MVSPSLRSQGREGPTGADKMATTTPPRHEGGMLAALREIQGTIILTYIHIEK